MVSTASVQGKRQCVSDVIVVEFPVIGTSGNAEAGHTGSRVPFQNLGFSLRHLQECIGDIRLVSFKLQQYFCKRPVAGYHSWLTRHIHVVVSKCLENTKLLRAGVFHNDDAGTATSASFGHNYLAPTLFEARGEWEITIVAQSLT